MSKTHTRHDFSRLFDVIGELLPERTCLILQGGTTFFLRSNLADVPVSTVRNARLNWIAKSLTLA